jgi:hypothetical protein
VAACRAGRAPGLVFTAARLPACLPACLPAVPCQSVGRCIHTYFTRDIYCTRCFSSWNVKSLSFGSAAFAAGEVRSQMNSSITTLPMMVINVCLCDVTITGGRSVRQCLSTEHQLAPTQQTNGDTRIDGSCQSHSRTTQPPPTNTHNRRTQVAVPIHRRASWRCVRGARRARAVW